MIPLTVYAFDPQPLSLEGLRRILLDSREFCLVGASASIEKVMAEVRELCPELIVLSVGSGWHGVRQIIGDLKHSHMASRTIFLGDGLTDSDRLRAVQAGVRGFLTRSSPVKTVLECLRQVAGGQIWLHPGLPPQGSPATDERPAVRLTPRERQIVQLVARGCKNREIAEELSISTGTVKVHLMHVFEKTGVQDRYELAIHSRRFLGRPATGCDPEQVHG